MVTLHIISYGLISSISREMSQSVNIDKRLCIFHSELRINKGSVGGAPHLGTCIHNYESCNNTLNIL